MTGEAVQTKKTRSITGKLYRAYLFKRIRIYLAEDILISLLLTVGAFVQQEYILTGSLARDRIRYLSLNPDRKTAMERIWYIVADKDGDILMQAYLFPILRVVFLIVAGIVALQMFMIVLSWMRDNRRIRSILRPLTDLALRADELNRMSFGEDKYQRMEDAIERLQVDDTRRLSFGDEDLRGVEAAMNNLLTRMREANMQQARFVNDASHELRTPIAVIRGYADMLDRWGKTDEKILEESITAIRHESDHMSRLVEQLLFLARGDAGKTVFEPEETDVNAFMREIYEESLMIDEAHAYRFVPLAEENAPLLYADRGLLKQALRVLVDNAAKYTEKGDEIVLSAGVTKPSAPGEPPHLYLQVQDTGRGMQEADVTHMFDRFYRSEEVRSVQGTGLGLSIAKWIVDRHGAHFEVLSREGLGTRIRIVMP